MAQTTDRAALLRSATPEVTQFIELSMQLTQAAIALTGDPEVDDDVLKMMRQVRSACAVLMAALQQVAAMAPGGLNPAPPMV